MSSPQNHVVSLAREIIEGELTNVCPADLVLLAKASGLKKSYDAETYAHKVLRDFAQKRGYFSNLAAAA